MPSQIRLHRAALLGALLVLATGAHAQLRDVAEQAYLAYEDGHYAQALGLYEQASDQGDPTAAERAAAMLLFGERLYGRQVGRDPQRAKRHLLRAATAGSPSSIFWLGRLGFPWLPDAKVGEPDPGPTRVAGEDSESRPTGHRAQFLSGRRSSLSGTAVPPDGWRAPEPHSFR